MSSAKQMQRMFVSVASLASRALVMKAEQVRDKIKSEFDKYIGRGRRTRTKSDHAQLNKCKFVQYTHLVHETVTQILAISQCFHLGARANQNELQ